MKRSPEWVVAMMICEVTGCPHPNRLAEHNVGVPEFYDWFGYFLWKNDDGTPDETEQVAFLNQYMAEEEAWANR